MARYISTVDGQRYVVEIRLMPNSRFDMSTWRAELGEEHGDIGEAPAEEREALDRIVRLLQYAPPRPH